jgi:hypothetical protein
MNRSVKNPFYNFRNYEAKTQLSKGRQKRKTVLGFEPKERFIKRKKKHN